jgi:hypothetical protein
MTSTKSPDPWGPDDLPTTREDIRALRELRPRGGSDWLADLTCLAATAPHGATDLRRRRTFAGLSPFEI